MHPVQCNLSEPFHAHSHNPNRIRENLRECVVRAAQVPVRVGAADALSAVQTAHLPSGCPQGLATGLRDWCRILPLSDGCVGLGDSVG